MKWHFLSAYLLCTVGFVTTAWLSMALNLNLFWLALANVYALTLLSRHLQLDLKYGWVWNITKQTQVTFAGHFLFLNCGLTGGWCWVKDNLGLTVCSSHQVTYYDAVKLSSTIGNGWDNLWLKITELGATRLESIQSNPMSSDGRR